MSGFRNHYLVAQWGSVVQRRKSLAMRLEPDEIPGAGWSVTSEQCLRSGFIGPNTERAKRSRDAGGFISWRSFRQSGTARSFWSQTTPYALVDDAREAVSHAFEHAEINPQFSGKVLDRREIDGLTIPGIESTFAREDIAMTGKGILNTKYFLGSFQRIVLTLACSEYGVGWSWDEVLNLAELQLLRVRRVLTEIGE